MELNYGAAPVLQLSLYAALDVDTTRPLRAGCGDLQLSAKARFLHPAEGSWAADAAVFPAVTLPTGAGVFHTGHVSLFLPIWLQKAFGKWPTFSGGGYDLNPEVSQRNFTLIGWALTGRQHLPQRFGFLARLRQREVSAAAQPHFRSLALADVHEHPASPAAVVNRQIEAAAIGMAAQSLQLSQLNRCERSPFWIKELT